MPMKPWCWEAKAIFSTTALPDPLPPLAAAKGTEMAGSVGVRSRAVRATRGAKAEPTQERTRGERERMTTSGLRGRLPPASCRRRTVIGEQRAFPGPSGHPLPGVEIRDPGWIDLGVDLGKSRGRDQVHPSRRETG